MVRVYNNQYKCNYLRKKKLFLIFFCFISEIYIIILDILKQNLTLIAYLFSKLRIAKEVVR